MKIKKLKKKLICKLQNLKELITKNLGDILSFIALLIIAINSYMINPNFGGYVVAGELILISYLLSRNKNS